MPMMDRNIVIVGKGIQPDVISEPWLVKNGVAKDGQIHGTRVCTELFSMYNTSVLNLQVLPERITFRWKDTTPDSDALESIARFVAVVPAASFHAVGLNSLWDITPAELGGKTVVEFMKEHMQFKKALPPELSTAALGFSALTSSVYESQMRLNVGLMAEDASQPLRLTKISADTNFNRDVGETPDPRATVLEFISKWPECVNNVNSIIAHLF